LVPGHIARRSRAEQVETHGREAFVVGILAGFNPADPASAADPILTVRQAAEMLNLHPDTVRRLARDGKLPGAFKPNLDERSQWPFRPSQLVPFCGSGPSRHALLEAAGHYRRARYSGPTRRDPRTGELVWDDGPAPRARTVRSAEELPTEAEQQAA